MTLTFVFFLITVGASLAIGLAFLKRSGKTAAWLEDIEARRVPVARRVDRIDRQVERQ